jgi:single-stranded-DNA-specific exonuclease
MPTSKYFLNVKKSCRGKAWRGPTENQIRIAEQISQTNNLPLQVSNVLARLEVDALTVEDFFSPKLKNLLPNPTHLKDMVKASNRLVNAIENYEKIAIFADYDVDGAASAALIISWLKAFGINPTLYVPDRITEGYGLIIKRLQNYLKIIN